MRYADLYKEFNLIVDIDAGSGVINDQARYDELVAQHTALVKADDHFVGIKLCFQVKDNVVEPFYQVTVVCRIEGKYYSVLAPSSVADKVSLDLFNKWKKGDADFFDVIPNNVWSSTNA